MSRISDGGQKWFPMPLWWDQDEQLVGLPDSAVLLFLKLVALCHRVGNGGNLTWDQVMLMARTVGRGREAVVRLVSAGCISVAPPLPPGCISAASSLYPGCTPAALSLPSRWYLAAKSPESIPAAQNKSSRAISEEQRPRVKEREIERETERTPSGSVRSVSAQAAPRGTGGATQPAPTDGDRLEATQPPTTKNEAIRIARERIAKRQGPTTGKDISFSRYDPNRPIAKLNGNIGGNTE